MQEDVNIGYTALALTLDLQVFSYTGATEVVINVQLQLDVACLRAQPR